MSEGVSEEPAGQPEGLDVDVTAASNIEESDQSSLFWKEINLARTDPRAYAEFVKERRELIEYVLNQQVTSPFHKGKASGNFTPPDFSCGDTDRPESREELFPVLNQDPVASTIEYLEGVEALPAMTVDLELEQSKSPKKVKAPKKKALTFSEAPVDKDDASSVGSEKGHSPAPMKSNLRTISMGDFLSKRSHQHVPIPVGLEPRDAVVVMLTACGDDTFKLRGLLFDSSVKRGIIANQPAPLLRSAPVVPPSPDGRPVETEDRFAVVLVREAPETARSANIIIETHRTEHTNQEAENTTLRNRKRLHNVGIEAPVLVTDEDKCTRGDFLHMRLPVYQESRKVAALPEVFDIYKIGGWRLAFEQESRPFGKPVTHGILSKWRGGEVSNADFSRSRLPGAGEKLYHRATKLPKFQDSLIMERNFKHTDTFGSSFQTKRSNDVINEYKASLALKDAIDHEGFWKHSLKAIAEGDFDLAIKTLTQAISYDDNKSLAMLLRGQVFLRMGYNELAIHDVHGSLAINPRSSAAYQTMAQAKMAAGDYKGALNEFDRYLGLEDASEQDSMDIAFCKAKMAEYRTAIDTYSSVIERNPQNHRAYQRRSFCYALIDDEEKALLDQISAEDIRNSLGEKDEYSSKNPFSQDEGTPCSGLPDCQCPDCSKKREDNQLYFQLAMSSYEDVDRLLVKVEDQHRDGVYQMDKGVANLIGRQSEIKDKKSREIEQEMEAMREERKKMKKAVARGKKKKKEHKDKPPALFGGKLSTDWYIGGLKSVFAKVSERDNNTVEGEAKEVNVENGVGEDKVGHHRNSSKIEEMMDHRRRSSATRHGPVVDLNEDSVDDDEVLREKAGASIRNAINLSKQRSVRDHTQFVDDLASKFKRTNTMLKLGGLKEEKSRAGTPKSSGRDGGTLGGGMLMGNDWFNSQEAVENLKRVSTPPVLDKKVSRRMSSMGAGPPVAVDTPNTSSLKKLSKQMSTLQMVKQGSMIALHALGSGGMPKS